MMNPSNRFATIVLAAGVVVLLIAILFGEHMGDRVMTEAAENGSLSPTPIVTPVPEPTAGPYGPDWKRSQTLAAARDPHFPDPRVPPKPLPTPHAAADRRRRPPTLDAESEHPDLAPDAAAEPDALARRPSRRTRAASKPEPRAAGDASRPL